MRIFTKGIFLLSALLLCFAPGLNAQNQKKTVIFAGTVVEKGGNTPIAYAVVALPELSMAAATNNLGEFEIKSIQPGTYKVEVSSLGYETISTTIDLKESVYSVSYALEESSFRMDEVVVTAQSSKAGAATASKISRMAMDHMQVSSLADVMSMLPGGSITAKPDLAKLSTLRIRGDFAVEGSKTSLDNSAGLGTAIIMNGAAISNNANMSMLNSTTGTNITGGTSNPVVSTNSGVDLRSITTDNIESIEVIRGVASVEYGDISSGAVIVNSKAGLAPLAVKFNTNPNLYSFAVTQGIKLSNKVGGGALNYGADYAYSTYKPVEGYDTYQRVTGQLGYTNTIGKLYTNSSFNLNYSRDRREPNPDDKHDYETLNQKDIGFRFTTNNTINFNQGWFKNIQTVASLAYTNRKTYYQDEGTNADWPYSQSMTDGATLSSIPGRDVFLNDGSKITNIPAGEENLKAWMLPGAYLYQYNIYGKELNTTLKLKFNFAGKIGTTNHRFIVGANFENSGNLGKGKVFDPEYPPYRDNGYNFSTQRNRPFNDIPFMNQLGVYAEENFSYKFGERELNIFAGVRYDKVFNFGSGFSPRVNASVDIIPEMLSVRGGYGTFTKAPTLLLMYPDNAYFDMLNFNNATTTAPESQKFQVLTTRIFSTENPNLEMAKNTKIEVGLDFTINKIRASFTAYQDKMNNGYMLDRTPETFKVVAHKEYAEVTPRPSDLTQLPALKEKLSGNYMLQYTMPTNNRCYVSKGIEMDIDFGRIDAIRTSINLNGAWTRYKHWSKGYTFWNLDKETDFTKKPHMGVFEPGAKKVNKEQISTNLRITHNIPKIGFVITLTTGVIWKENYWETFGNDSIPIKYISLKDGMMHDITEAQLADKEFQTIDQRSHLDDKRLIKEGNMPPLVCFNLNITKEIGNFARVSFFVNNMFRSTPLYESTVYPGNFTRRNKESFFFGLELSATIGGKRKK